MHNGELCNTNNDRQLTDHIMKEFKSCAPGAKYGHDQTIEVGHNLINTCYIYSAGRRRYEALEQTLTSLPLKTFWGPFRRPGCSLQSRNAS